MGTDAHPLAGRLKPGLLRRLLHGVFILFAVFVAWRLAQQALPRYLPRDWSKAHDLDSLQDWHAARLFLEGVNPYSKEGVEKLHGAFGHPPIALLWLLPLARLDKPIAAELMDLSTLFLLAVHLYICARAIRFPSPIALSMLLFGWALNTEGLVNHWHAIQTSEQIAFSLVVCWVCLRRGREWQAGIALAFAATLKLFPGVLFLFLLLARRFRAFVSASVGFGVAVGVVTTRYGFKMWEDFFVTQKPIADAWMGSMRNASLQGAVIRLLTPACVASPVPTSKSKYIATGISLLLLAIASVASLRALRRARHEDPRLIDVPFALFTVIAVFINPWAWEHYWVLLIQPAFVVASTLYGRFRDTLNDWLDEATSHRALVATALASLIGAAGLLGVAKLILLQNIHTDNLFNDYAANKSDWSHHAFHMYEVFNSAPWVIMILLGLMAVLLVPRGDRRGSWRGSAPPAGGS